MRRGAISGVALAVLAMALMLTGWSWPLAVGLVVATFLNGVRMGRQL
jgi:hypothetical protein